ncbi:hypothetical protein F0562_027896 [Nyssa sinensis]|uniref:Uncharacterized protein n=1 Tax=Nyssa sinensis TaxID=561372 RepID=A0A5J5BAP3_9ASTE|nr:hypothetical protein F0562_027896 [Nyssa sinensis]
MAINQPSTTMIIDHHDAMDVPPSTNDSAPTSSGPPQNVIASTDHSANVSTKSQVINSSASHATDDPSDIMMARTPPATHKVGNIFPRKLFSLKRIMRDLPLTLISLQISVKLQEEAFLMTDVKEDAALVGASGMHVTWAQVAQLFKTKACVGSSQNSVEKAICPIKPILPSVTHRPMASGMSDSHDTPNCIPAPTSEIVQPSHLNNAATVLPLVSHSDQANLQHSPTLTRPHHITVCTVAPSMLTAHIPCGYSGQTTAKSYCPTVNHQKQSALITPTQLPNSATTAFPYACSSSIAAYDSNGSRPSTLSSLGAWESYHIGPHQPPTTSNVHSYTVVQPTAHTSTSVDPQSYPHMVA